MTEKEFVEQSLALLFKQLVLLSEFSLGIKKEPMHNKEIASTMLSIVLYAADELPKLVQSDTANGSD